MSEVRQEEGSVRVCGEEETYSLSLAGFRLKEIIYTDEVKTLTDSVPHRDSSNTYINSWDKPSKQVLARVPRFVMVQDKDTSLAEACKLINKLEGELDKRHEDEMKATQEASDQKKRADRLDGMLKNANASFDRANKREVDLREKNAKLEGDIGKIRAAIGEIRMKEIIG